MYIKPIACLAIIALLGMSSAVTAEEYIIDTKGAHASIQFKIKHLGYSWLHGRFNKFTGTFSYDEASPETAKVDVTIDATSLDSNHAERDKHLKGGDFLDVSSHKEAHFVSTGVTVKGAGKAILHGNLTLRGVTKPLDIEVNQVGAGSDPWGGYRRGFTGTTRFALADFGIDFNLGPASKEVELILNVEGVRQ